jgi:hypothetical protein
VANAVIDGTDAIMLSVRMRWVFIRTGGSDHDKDCIGYLKRADIVGATLLIFRWGGGGYPPHAVCEAAAWADAILRHSDCRITLSGATALYLAKLRYGFLYMHFLRT